MSVKLFEKWKLRMAKGIILAIAGLLLLRFKVDMYIQYHSFIGIFFIVLGIIDLFIAYKNRNLNYAWHWNMAEGLLQFFIGLLILLRSDIIFQTPQVIFGILAIFWGILHFSASYNYKTVGIIKWRLAAISGIIAIVAGFLIFYLPSDIIPIGISIFIVIEGLLIALNSFFLEQVSGDYS